jgi:O-antigen ligase
MPPPPVSTQPAQPPHNPDGGFARRFVPATRQLTWLAVFLMASFLLFPRFAPVILFGILLAAIVTSLFLAARGLAANPLSIGSREGNLAFIAAGTFTAWAFIACLWSADPVGGFNKVLILTGVLALLSAAVAHVELTGSNMTDALWRGLIIGLLIGAVYLSIEAVTSRAISKFIFTHLPSLQSGYEKHLRIRNGQIVNVSDANINRATAVFSLFLWPALLTVQTALQGRFKILALSILAMSGAVLMIFSRHQTSQLAILASGIVFGLACYAPIAARRLVAAGWVAVTALVVPLSLAAYSNQLQVSPELFNTAKARIIIWGYTAEQVLHRPLIGIGTNATGALDQQRDTADKEKPAGYASARETRAHPHNFYLQVWYELGAVGAVLFGLIGLAVLNTIKGLPAALHPMALAQFAMTAAMIGSSYGLWQTWLQASIAFAIIALLMAVKRARTIDGSATPSSQMGSE